MTEKKHELGKRGEALAASYLKRLGFKILDQNWEGQTGELDLIALDGETLVFVEVKTRSSDTFGSPKDAVNRRKKSHVEKVAKEYVKVKEIGKKKMRFDVVSVSIKGNTLFDRLRSPEIEHIKNAFETKK